MRTLKARPTAPQAALALNYVLNIVRKFSAAYTEYTWHYLDMISEQHDTSTSPRDSERGCKGTFSKAAASATLEELDRAANIESCRQPEVATSEVPIDWTSSRGDAQWRKTE